MPYHQTSATDIIKTARLRGQVQHFYERLDRLEATGIMSNLWKRYREDIQRKDTKAPVGRTWYWTFIVTPWDIMQQWQSLKAEKYNADIMVSNTEGLIEQHKNYRSAVQQRLNEFRPILEAAQQQLIVEVSEIGSDQLEVVFRDGRTNRYDEPLRDVVDALIEAVLGDGGERDVATKVEDENIDLPKKPRTLQKWKRAYAIICQTRENFLNAYDEGKTDDPTPKAADYIDALKAEQITYTGRQINKIMKAGDAGLLK